MILSKFSVKNYRSLLDVSIDFHSGIPVSICGENNVGKTNFLRAMNLFFNHTTNSISYNPKDDIPHHIYYGAKGRRYQTILSAEFIVGKNIIEGKIIFKPGEVKYFINSESCNETEFKKRVINNFHFILIESNNIDLPKLIAVTLERDGLLSLDSKRRKQSEPLEKLKEFIELSKNAIKDIEKEINLCFKELTDFEGILKGKELQIKFAEFEKLRDAVKNMTSITLFDGNNHSIANKGSGAQRAVFLSLMKYISKNIKDKTVIWGVDEPEVFLQPKLQKKVFHSFSEMTLDDKQVIVLTTHSQHFINLKNVNSINLFIGHVEEKTYSGKKGKVFYSLDTQSPKYRSISEKIGAIKEQLGIHSNDGWELLPFNILVEGESDKKYIDLLLRSRGVTVPNIIWSGGASKIIRYLQYYNSFAQDNVFENKPKIICLFDHDKEGIEQFDKLKTDKFPNLEVIKLYIPRCIMERNDKSHWEVEDFIPYNLFIEAVNSLLKEKKYSSISSKQVRNRYLPAHKDKAILDYISECVSGNNPEKEPIDFTQGGRKKELCMKFNAIFEERLEELSSCLDDVHINFINKLVSN